MTAVWDTSDKRGAELLVLLALADWANDRGECDPSYSQLAEKARVDRRRAMRIVDGLIKAGDVDKTTGAGFVFGKNAVSNQLRLTKYVNPSGARATTLVAPVPLALVAPVPPTTVNSNGQQQSTAPAPVGAGTDATPAHVQPSGAPTVASHRAEASTPTVARKPRAARPPDPLADVALDIMADTTGRRELPSRRYAALIWPLVRDIGKLTGESPAPSAAVWWSFREYIDNREKDGWRFVKAHNARDEFGKWVANGGGPTIAAVLAMYPRGGVS